MQHVTLEKAFNVSYSISHVDVAIEAKSTRPIYSPSFPETATVLARPLAHHKATPPGEHEENMNIMPRSRQTSALNTYAGERFSDDDDDEDSQSDISDDEQRKHGQFHDAYSVFEACFNDVASPSSSISSEHSNARKDTKESNELPSASETEDGSFTYPFLDDDEQNDLAIIVRALLSHANTSSDTIPSSALSVKFSTFTLQEYESLRFIEPSPNLLSSAITRRRTLKHPLNLHRQEDSGFEDAQATRPLPSVYSQTVGKVRTSYKPLPVLDSHTGLTRANSELGQTTKPLPRRYRQPVFPVVVRQETYPVSEDEDDESVDELANRIIADKENLAPHDAYVEQNGRNGNTIQATNVHVHLASSDAAAQSESLMPAKPPRRVIREADSPMLREQKAWADFQPVRNRNTAYSGVGCATSRIIKPAWDYPRIGRFRREPFDNEIPTGLSDLTPTRDEGEAADISHQYASSRNPERSHEGGAMRAHVLQSRLSSGGSTTSRSSTISDSVSSAEKAEVDSQNYEDAEDDDSMIFQPNDKAYDSSPTPNSSQPDLLPAGLSLWKLKTPSTAVGLADATVPPSPVALNKRAISTTTSSSHAGAGFCGVIPSDIAYGWGPEEEAKLTSAPGEPVAATDNLGTAKTGIGWDDDDDDHENNASCVPMTTKSDRVNGSAWELAKVPTPGYPVSSKNRSPTNSGAHPERQLAPSLDTIRARYEIGVSSKSNQGASTNTFTPEKLAEIPASTAAGTSRTLIASNEVDGFSYAAEKGSLAAGFTSIIREPTVSLQQVHTLPLPAQPTADT
ncbi:hypothetical protein P389DRAFT_167168 [Cystobasidium minutum MCA 4210]|uniref:uncharacterized protein n=1 Tax=Cystobasidium minutum MCA 4210 TaxID=1397322 RepID=UPI0034CE6022|eukprot:jgi/Rhomi1/167168/fgenesh1_kg.2_\